MFPFNLVTLGLPGGQAGETLEPECIGQKSTFKLRPPFIWYVAPHEWVINIWRFETTKWSQIQELQYPWSPINMKELFFLRISTLEVETTTLGRNVGHQLCVHVDVVPHPRRTEISKFALSKAKKLVYIRVAFMFQCDRSI